MKDVSIDSKCINSIRFLSVDAIQKAKSGHPGLPLGAAPMAYVLWTRHLKQNPSKPAWPDRDRFVLSAGHGSMLLYSLLHLSGYNLPLEQLKKFRQMGSIASGHPECFITPGVEATTGPLGQGIANAVGMAIAEAHLSSVFNRPDAPPIVDHFTYSLVSDGDLMEGVAYEACALAGHLRLGKLILLYDNNSISLSGSTGLCFTEDIEKRFESFGWHVQVVPDGNDIDLIDSALCSAKGETDRPSFISVRTHIGYGSPFENSHKAHGAPLGADGVIATKKKLGWPLEPDFYIPEGVYEYFKKLISPFIEKNHVWDRDFEEYSKRYPAMAVEFNRRRENALPEGWDDELPGYSPKHNSYATRKASEDALNALARKLPELIGGCADLSPSTFARLSEMGDFESKEINNKAILGKAGGVWDYSGRNIHFGVREHAMGSISVGMALHGGLLPFTGTFFVFSDYMRPPIRLAALSGLRIIFVFSHDSIGVGEDGPTHQPVEQLAGLRAIPDLVVIRPSDANEAIEGWRVAIESLNCPVVFVLSRQNIAVLDRTRFADASNLRRGGYILREPSQKPDIIIIATGSEVELAIESAKELSKEEIEARVVSMPSWELFDAQDEEYRESVLSKDIKARMAIEAGVKMGWERYIGKSGVFIGMKGFGESGPGTELFKKYGFTVENVVCKAKELLEWIKK